jgi:ubiquinone/menaquinone biosynthesis C-methylase UbiE
MLRKVLHHARQGTLMRAVLRRLGLSRSSGAAPDHYRGDSAKNYLSKRLKQEMWHREQTIIEELLASIPDGSTVLDVAFGTGRFVDMYLRKRMSVYGIDISPDMLAAAREALGPSYERCRIHLGSADSLPYESEFFHLVVCFRFFGLISFEMAERVLSEIHRVSKGPVIIRVPIRNRATPPPPPPKRTDPVEGRLYEHELVALFARFGFAIVDQRLIAERKKVSYVVYVISKLSVRLRNAAVASGYCETSAG